MHSDRRSSTQSGLALRKNALAGNNTDDKAHDKHANGQTNVQAVQIHILYRQDSVRNARREESPKNQHTPLQSELFQFQLEYEQEDEDRGPLDDPAIH